MERAIWTSRDFQQLAEWKSMVEFGLGRFLQLRQLWGADAGDGDGQSVAGGDVLHRGAGSEQCEQLHAAKPWHRADQLHDWGAEFGFQWECDQSGFAGGGGGLLPG